MRSLVLALAMLPAAVAAQQPAPPIIDMHMHSSRLADFTALTGGRAPIPHCVPMTDYRAVTAGREWPRVFAEAEPPCRATLSPLTDEEVLQRTLAAMERFNVYGVASGPQLEAWARAAPARIIPSLGLSGGPQMPPVESLRAWVRAGRFRVLGEVVAQYAGLEPDDPSLRPMWALAEELDVPVGIHIGTGPVGAPYIAPFSRYRARLHSPLLMEEVLVRHPGLRVYVMHAGWPMLDDLLALLWAHPQVYVDVGVISWALPRAEFHRYLQRIVEAGFGKRVMFGSDNMVWPETVEMAIEAVGSASFLTAEQRRDILYNNAARFLRLGPEEIARHHGR